jgi:hypothetical protein
MMEHKREGLEPQIIILLKKMMQLACILILNELSTQKDWPPLVN